MDLPVIGAHCELENCQSLDLLPIKCDSCQQVFCRHHITFAAHSCKSFESTHQSLDELKGDVPTVKKSRCAFNGCQKPSLEAAFRGDTTQDSEELHRTAAICQHCAQAYCAAHRHPPDHACKHDPPAPSSTAKNPEAHALLNKHFPASATPLSVSGKKPPPRPTDPKKLARLRAVELMRMRHQAVPADPKDATAAVPLTQRLHLKVVHVDAKEKIFWLRKTVGTGRALDLIAEQFSVRITDSSPVSLTKRSSDDGTEPLYNAKPLSEQIEDGETIYISVGTL